MKLSFLPINSVINISELEETMPATKLKSICAAICMSALAVSAFVQSAHAADAAHRFMRTVANKLQAAQRKPELLDRAASFTNVVKSYAHLGKIGHAALGDYQNQLRKNQRDIYYAGMAGWIGYYAAGEAIKYPVKKVLLTTTAKRDGNYYIIDSKVELENAEVYDVRWFLVRFEQSFKVVEVQIDIGLGLTDITPYLRSIFVDHIEENDKSVANLVATLARYSN
ncbi:MAG: ABC transporter substrate-binding protein [Pseudomonadota bacterium]